MSSKIIVPQFAPADDDRPIPERIAALYMFRLAFQDVDSVRYYGILDWISGIVPDAQASKLWSAMKKRYFQTSTGCRSLPYRARDGKTYQRDYANAETLYMITQRMQANSGNRDAVLLFLARSGVVLDELVRDPGKAELLFAGLDDDKEYRKLMREGYSHEEATQWLETRRSQKAEWKRLTTEWHSRGVSQGFDYARLSNEVSRVATGRTATELRAIMHIDGTPRDYLCAADNAAIEITSTTSRILHRQRNSQGVDELSDDVKDVKGIIDAARPEIERVFSRKPRRLPAGKPQGTA